MNGPNPWTERDDEQADAARAPRPPHPAPPRQSRPVTFSRTNLRQAMQPAPAPAPTMPTQSVPSQAVPTQIHFGVGRSRKVHLARPPHPGRQERQEHPVGPAPHPQDAPAAATPTPSEFVSDTPPPPFGQDDFLMAPPLTTLSGQHPMPTDHGDQQPFAEPPATSFPPPAPADQSSSAGPRKPRLTLRQHRAKEADAADWAPATPVGPYARTEATRFLCAGAQTDPAFARQVVTALVKERERFVAPGYGYDVVPVLGHALAARGRQRITRLVMAAGLLPALILAFVGPRAFVGGLIFAVWLAWAAIVVERLMSLQILTAHLKQPRVGVRHPGFTGRPPQHPDLTHELAWTLQAEQDPDAGVVFYGGYTPFVGAGRPARSWSFAVPVERAGGPRHARDSEAERRAVAERAAAAQREPAAFTASELADYLRDRLAVTLPEELGEQAAGLQVSTRWHCRVTGPTRPTPESRWSDEPPAGDGVGPARKHVTVRLGADPAELVVSAFIGFELSGRTLHTEFHAFTLGPIRAEYRQADRLADELTPATVAAVAVESLSRLVMPVVRAVGAALAVPRWASRAAALVNRPLAAPEGASAAQDAERARDYGATVSVRELAAADQYGDLFQQAAVRRDTTLVERRVLALVLEYLEARRVDTTEFRERQNALFNAGVVREGADSLG